MLFKYMLAVVLMSLTGRAVAAEPDTILISDSVADNYLLSDKAFKAHVVSFKDKSRIIIAFPAGNSGVLIDLTQDVKVDRLMPLRAFGEGDGYGVAVKVRISAPRTRIERVVQGSMREIRRYIHTGDDKYERGVVAAFGAAFGRLSEEDRNLLTAGGAIPSIANDSFHLSWKPVRDRTLRTVEQRRGEYAGEREYVLRISVPPTCRTMGGQKLVLSCDGGEPLEMTLEAVTPYAPLTPIPEQDLLWGASHPEARKIPANLSQLLERSLVSLRFLACREKLMAGSFRFLTYFGRDTLITARLLLRVAGPQLLEAAYRSVVERLSPDGQVAHEEDIGNQAILRHMESFAHLVSQGHNDQAVKEMLAFREDVLDYKMVDDNFLLAPFVRDLLNLDAQRFGKAGLAAVLGGTDGTLWPRLATHLEFVLSQASNPANEHFGIALKKNEEVGNWRDSIDGLAGGRYPGDVNTFLVQSALVAVGEIVNRPQARIAPLKKLIAQGGFPLLQKVTSQPEWLDGIMRQWEEIGARYEVHRPLPHMRSTASRFLQAMPAEQRAVFGAQEVEKGCSVARFVAGQCFPAALADGLTFPALSLDGQGKPLAILHSDTVFALFDQPQPPDILEQMLAAFTLPYPLGLWTDAGPVVANPMYAGSVEEWPRFANKAYHGAVVWGWVVGMLKLGVEKQARLLEEHAGGCAEACDELKKMSGKLKAALDNIAAMGAAELWTWEAKEGKLRPADFGAEGHMTLSNAVQLWSTVWLGAL